MRLKNRTLYLWFAMFLLSCKTTTYINHYNEPSVWSKLHYHPIGSPLKRVDTSFLFVSNRTFLPDSLRFATEEIDTSVVHYFMIQQEKSDWHIIELNSLQEGISYMPKRDWVVYSEGMGKLFTGNIERAYLMQQTYGINIILFDYASIHSDFGILKNFNYSLSNSKKSYRQYADLLRQVAGLKSEGVFGTSRLSVFLHSMGNLMLREMIRDSTLAAVPRFAENVMLNAACVPRRHHTKWIENIDFAKHILVHYNKADYKLRGAQWITGNYKLGTRPKSPRSPKVSYVDFHEAVGLTHNYFLWIPGRANPLSPAIKNYFKAALHGEQIGFNEASRQQKIKKAGFSIPRDPAFPAKRKNP